MTPATNINTDIATMTNAAFDNMLSQLARPIVDEAKATLKLAQFDETSPDLYFEQMGLVEKTAYITHRTVLKRFIRMLAHLQKADRATTADGLAGDAARNAAHARRATRAATITQLIALRRAGKVWSASQYRIAQSQTEATQLPEVLAVTLQDALEALWRVGFCADQPDAWFAGQGIVTKADYLVHRAQLKQVSRDMADLQVADRIIMRTKGQALHWGDRAYAQSQSAQRATTITALIALRRAGKAWSSHQAARALDAKAQGTDAA